MGTDVAGLLYLLELEAWASALALSFSFTKPFVAIVVSVVPTTTISTPVVPVTILRLIYHICSCYIFPGLSLVTVCPTPDLPPPEWVCVISIITMRPLWGEDQSWLNSNPGCSSLPQLRPGLWDIICLKVKS